MTPLFCRLEKLMESTGGVGVALVATESGASTDWQSIYILSSPNETALLAVLTKLPIVVIGLAPDPVDDCLEWLYMTIPVFDACLNVLLGSPLNSASVILRLDDENTIYSIDLEQYFVLDY